MDEQAMIPYFVHEGDMTRLERINKRLWILVLVIFLAFIGTNAGWIIYENQFEDVAVQQEIDTGNGAAAVSGIGDVTIYGEGPADGEGSPQEDGR